jgi:glyoxylase I family protein
MAMQQLRGFHHITLSVTDLRVSVPWYRDVLELSPAAERSGPGWRRILLRADTGVVIGLTQHDATPRRDRFDERRVGLDHVSITCPDLDTLESWRARLDELEIPHGGITAASYAHTLVCRDPDGIPIELFVAT